MIGPVITPDLLHGKVVVVTGAARSLGAAMSDYFSQAGAIVIKTDIDDGQGVVHLDVSARRDWELVIKKVIDDHGHLDGLVNNAAVLFGAMPFWEETDEQFARLLEVNVMGTWIGIQVTSRVMATRFRGSIINFSSTSGVMGAANYAGYGTTRWAVRGMTKHCAVDLAKQGIRVNSLHPHGIRGTGMVGPSAGVVEERARDSNNPLGRMGTTVDVAATVAFLLSDHSSWITGREFVLDGGASLTSAI